jgi:hypothetical protein
MKTVKAIGENLDLVILSIILITLIGVTIWNVQEYGIAASPW